MKTVVVTGATSGIGMEVLRLLSREGYRVAGVSRTAEGCERVDVPDVKWFVGDLMQQREVNRVADEINAWLGEVSAGKLYALINNAGCARNRYTTTEDGYEQQFALNYLAGFLLTHRLLPALLHGGRVLMTASRSHMGIKVHWNDVMLRRRYNPLTAYKQSKLCDILFAKGLNDRYSEEGLRAYAVDPGLVNTAIGDKSSGIVKFVWSFRKPHGTDASVPAETYSLLCNAKQPELLSLRRTGVQS